MADTRDYGDGEEIVGWNIYADGGARELVGCEGILDDGDGEANARLMAAAPELLAAAERIEKRIAYYASMGEQAQINIEQWAYTDNSGDIAALRAAIAKASPALFDGDNALMMNESDAKAVGGKP